MIMPGNLVAVGKQTSRQSNGPWPWFTESAISSGWGGITHAKVTHGDPVSTAMVLTQGTPPGPGWPASPSPPGGSRDVADNVGVGIGQPMNGFFIRRGHTRGL